MRRIRVIPVLLMSNGGIVKTVNFRNPHYIGDPINTIRIFNDKEADEIMLLDIDCSRKNKEPDYELIKKIAGECFMPLAYGGGIRTVEHAKKIIRSGVEKVVINTAAYQNKLLIKEIAEIIGSQSVIVSVDYRKNFFGKNVIYTHGGKKKEASDIIEYVQEMEHFGAGECLLNSIDRDGTRKGYDTSTLKKITSVLKIPVIACGGANNINDFVDAVKLGGATAVAAGSMFIYMNNKESILINYPSQELLKNELYSKV